MSIFNTENTSSNSTNPTGSTSSNPSLFGAFGGPNPVSTTTPASTSGNLFGTANPSTTASGTTGNSIFGTAATTSTPAKSIFGVANPSTTTNSIFGGSSAPSFNLPKPTDQNTAVPSKPAPSNFFSTPSTTTTGTTGTSTTTPSSFFGLPPKPADTSSSSTTATPKTNTGLFGLTPSTTASATTGDSSTSATNASTNNTASNIFGSGIFGKPATATSATALPAATAPAFSLGGNKDAPATSTSNIFGDLSGNKGEKKDTPSPATFGIFGGPKLGEKSDATSATKDGDKKDAPSASAAALSTAGPVVAIPPPSMLRGKTLEEIVNRWTTELETNVREFNKFAAEVAVWDRALIENGNNIAALHSHVMAAERQQNDINESLDHIEQQQRDLASTLDTYEKVSQEILGGQGGSLRSLDTGPADNERDKNYMLATDLHTHLDDLSGSLTQMIESVNALSISSNSSESADDPMMQIAQILSSHLESLQWIDAAVREVESKTADVEKRVRESGHSLSNPGTKGRFGL